MSDSFINLNAEVNLWDENGKLQLHKDAEAARAYFLEHVNPNTVFFHDLREQAEYLIENGMWEREAVDKYGFDDFSKLFEFAYSFKFRFTSFLGAYKFYTSYALKTNDGTGYLERFEDRVALTAITYSEDLDHAYDVIESIMTGRFQPATPTFLNAGRANAGGPTSCFLLRVEDNMESISRSINDSLQASKRGGGVGLLLSNIREAGAPIKKVEGQASGVVPVMKLYEDSFSYANQLGQRQGAGVVSLSAHHPDIMTFLDTKRENADEKIRIKTLSLGVVIPDITFELAAKNEDMYLFSPYDVERVYGKPFADISVTDKYREMVDNPAISKKKVNARKFFTTLAEIQFESGYPYVMFEDTVNRANPTPNIGRITHSNLCQEIAQPFVPSTYNEDGSFDEVGMDVACNLGSLNVARASKLGTHDFQVLIDTAYRFLNKVAEDVNLDWSPTIARGNNTSRAIGLGQMGLHGALIERGIDYDSEEARIFFDTYMSEVTYLVIRASMLKAQRENGTFEGFQGSKWESGETVAEIAKHHARIDESSRTPFSRLKLNEEDWQELADDLMTHGLWNRNLQAIPPTGSISYINNATSSIHPITSLIEIRKEGKIGRVYYPAYGLNNENMKSVKTAYEMGYQAVIDMYAASQGYIDQGQSMTLFFPDEATTRDINRAQIAAHKAGIKNIYYIRLLQKAITGTEIEECVSCTI